MIQLERTLIIAPHPDDDVLAAGGLIQRVLGDGGAVHIVFVTDGENNPWPQRWMEKKWTISAEDRAAWGALRRDEAHCSLTRLGVSASGTTFLGLPDQRVSRLLRQGDTTLLRALRTLIRDFRPTLIVSPSSRDLHPDHRAVAWCAHVASAGEIPITTYVVHGRPDERRIAARLTLTESQQQRKRTAIECHRSQLMLSRARFLSYVQPAESFFRAEYDLMSGESPARGKLAAMRHVLHVLFSGGQPARDLRVEPPADVQDRPGDVAGLL